MLAIKKIYIWTRTRSMLRSKENKKKPKKEKTSSEEDEGDDGNSRGTKKNR